ncbi:ABC transporter substrate-binding protein [Spiribacter halobius]|uniref:ABC transporter substrate-binding protein n=1 Tax=Sediminicurvatus halobius TaxID=2182432 RepID=UPI001304906D|nr:ABC transporter substrate-binding protein [Spiribacter halobius]UEX79357.1 ABC transporter substrate-binding protein [Spiribacter halobius]
MTRAERIVSLLPGATETVAALGLEDALVGISADCDAPASVLDRPRVSQALIDPAQTPAAIDREVRERSARGAPLYQVDAAALAALRPDLVLAQSLCDVCAPTPGGLTAEAVAGASVLSLDARDLQGVFAEIAHIAEAAGAGSVGPRLLAQLRARLAAARRLPTRRPRVLTVEWPEPLFIGGHWVPEMVRLAGGQPLGVPGAHSRTVSWDEVRDFAPEVIILMPCGLGLEAAARTLPALTARPSWDTLPAVRTGAVHAVDGNRHFSRPGPGLVTGVEVLSALLAGSPPPPSLARRATPHELGGRRG